MLQPKHSKIFLKRTHGFDMVATAMSEYLDKFGVAKGKENEFAAKYWKLLEEKVVSKGVRMILPHNLGYMQVLEHAYSRKDKEHLMQYGNVDFSVVWIKHPMFVHHIIKPDKELNTLAKKNKKEGVVFLDNYVDGDTYVA